MPYEYLPVSVIVEESPPVSEWATTSYVPVDILPGHAATPVWTPLGPGLRGQRIFAGLASIELFSGDAGFLRDNLLSGDAKLWVVLRPTGNTPPVELVGVHADPTEGEAATYTPDDQVTTLPMPDSLGGVIAEFVTRHYVERPFVKRKRDQFREDGAPVEPQRRRREGKW
ncbi:MAG: DUF3305 domain-containing protein [Beijerinckiaceae bacterium]